MNPVGQFWYEVLIHEPKQLWTYLPSGRLVLSKAVAIHQYRDWATVCKFHKGITEVSFWVQTIKLVGKWNVARDKDRATYWDVTPAQMRNSFARRNRFDDRSMAGPDTSEYVMGGEKPKFRPEDF